jgi:hypothetical protein
MAMLFILTVVGVLTGFFSGYCCNLCARRANDGYGAIWDALTFVFGVLCVTGFFVAIGASFIEVVR